MEFRLLGSLEIVACNGALAPIGGTKQQLVIAALLLNANRTVTIDWLTRAVWQKSPQSIRSNLRTYISQLRKNFIAVDIPADRLVTETCGYRLAVSPGELDLSRFEQMVEEGERALKEADPVASLDRLERALDLWRGQPLAGLRVGPLLEIETLRLQERRMLVRQRWADAALAAGRHEEVAVELAGLVRSEPLREQLWSRYMLALYRGGRQAEALRAYRELFELLAGELGVEPGRRVQVLHQMMLTADPVLDAATSGPADADGSALFEPGGCALPDAAPNLGAGREPAARVWGGAARQGPMRWRPEN